MSLYPHTNLFFPAQRRTAFGNNHTNSELSRMFKIDQKSDTVF